MTTSAAPDRHRASRTTAALLGCGAVAGPLFTAVYLIEGALRPDYSVARNSVSSLALGPTGWTQSVNFLVAGILTTACAVGLRRVYRGAKGGLCGPVFLGVFAVGVLVAGLFATDPESGYPPGSPVPFPADRATFAGFAHDLSVQFGFPGFLIGCCLFVRLFLTRGERGWAAATAVTAVLFAVTAELAFRGFGQTGGLGAYAGFFERAAAVTAYAWLTALAVKLLRERPQRSSTGSSSRRRKTTLCRHRS